MLPFCPWHLFLSFVFIPWADNWSCQRRLTLLGVSATCSSWDKRACCRVGDRERRFPRKEPTLELPGCWVIKSVSGGVSQHIRLKGRTWVSVESEVNTERLKNKSLKCHRSKHFLMLFWENQNQISPWPWVRWLHHNARRCKVKKDIRCCAKPFGGTHGWCVLCYAGPGDAEMMVKWCLQRPLVSCTEANTPFTEVFCSLCNRSSRSHAEPMIGACGLGIQLQWNLPDNYIFSQLSRQSINSILSLHPKQVLSKQSCGGDS